MKLRLRVLLHFSVLILISAAFAHAQAVPATLRMEFSNPGLSPSHWTLVLRADSTGHFRTAADAGAAPRSEGAAIPAIEREIRLSDAFIDRVFKTVRRHKLLNEPCESHLKVAFQGWKKLTYEGPDGQGGCEFNYSKDKDIQELGDSLTAVASTLEEGVRLELLLQHDRLGLDHELAFMAEAAADGRLRQLCTIRGTLERLAEDPQVMERVRKRARAFLADDGK